MSCSICNRRLVFGLLLLAVSLLALPLSAQDKLKAAPVPFFQGMNLGLEFGGSLKRLFSDNWSTSANDFNIRNKFPTLEVAGHWKKPEKQASGI